jgi:hypothetical protein
MSDNFYVICPHCKRRLEFNVNIVQALGEYVAPETLKCSCPECNQVDFIFKIRSRFEAGEKKETVANGQLSGLP